METIGKIFFVVFVDISVLALFAILLVVFSAMFDNYLRVTYSKSAARFRWKDKNQNLFQKLFLLKQLDKLDKYQYLIYLLFVLSYSIFGLLLNVFLISGSLYFEDLFKILVIIILLTFFYAVRRNGISGD